MNRLFLPIKWLWRYKKYITVTMISALLVFFLKFPLNDLSDAISAQITAATGNKAFVQFDSLSLTLMPSPGVRTEGLSVVVSGADLRADSVTIAPSLLSVLANIFTVVSAASGSQEASIRLAENLSFDISADGLFKGDASLSRSSGTATEQGVERSRVRLAANKLNLTEVSRFAGWPIELHGHLELRTDMQLTMSLAAQPEGDYVLAIDRLSLPASTIPTQMGPVSLPALALNRVQFKGRWVEGTFFVEEGQFGQSGDPMYGRLKGQIGMTLTPGQGGRGMEFRLGSYNLNVDLTVTKPIQDQLSFVFLFLNNAKSDAGGGRARYVFRAMGASPTSGSPPQITRMNSI